MSTDTAEQAAPKLSLMWFQREVVLCTAAYMFLAAGRGAGKTDAIKARMKYLTTHFPGFRYMYVSPIFSQGNEVFKELMADNTFRTFIDFKRTNKRPYPQIVLKNGSSIWFRNFQRSENVRSSGEDEVCLDESQDPVFTEQAVESVILPLIGRRQSPAGGRGTFFLSGQFRGSDWRYEKYWKPGQDASRPKYKSWRIPSSMGYAFNTPGGAELLALRKETTRKAVWDQEWDCIPQANANAAFPEEQVAACIHGDVTDFEIKQCICSVDIGKIVDPTAVVVMNADGEVLMAETYRLGQPHAESARKAALTAAKYRAVMVVDATGGGGGGHNAPDEFPALYRTAVDDVNDTKQAYVEFREFFWSPKNKDRIINGLALAIQRGSITIPESHTELIKQLKAYEYRYSDRTRAYYFGAPKNQHDDLVAALAVAWESRRHRSDPNGISLSRA